MLKQILVAVAMSLASFLVIAAEGVAPLGVQVGVASYEQVKRIVGTKTPLQEGSNLYSGDKMLVGTGKGLAMADLSFVAFVFDKQKLLVATIFTFAGGVSTFDKFLKSIPGSYRLSQKRGSQGGERYAMLEQGDTVIEVSAAAKGEMVVGFLTKEFMSESKRIEDTKRRMKEGYLPERG